MFCLSVSYIRTQNDEEHAADCAKSCESFYCANNNESSDNWKDNLPETTFASYSIGSVPPEDFADDFGNAFDLIKVSQTQPLFSPTEASNLITLAESEGLSHNEYQSGKYKLGGDWLLNLPQTREWFNTKLETTFFPLLHHLFPTIISSPSVLRAHSVSLLKYNASHPRTDVHIDNGIFAMTLAMTPKVEYRGGGTYFEHMGVENVLPMDVGHGTFRPGSVRHGGHRVTSGTRYILGAFLLIEDRVEHVRRLKNRGSELRKTGDLDGAAKYFEWALGINPKCTTCLKDWAEVLHAQKRYEEAEIKIRSALSLLEDQDSDALFTLGLLLSEQNRDEESIEAYRKSVALNAEDAELCYNLGIKLGSKGDVEEERKMYERATTIDPDMGGAWINWGTSFAESGDMDNAEIKFLQAMRASPELTPKAMINLALVYQHRANTLALQGDLTGAKTAITDAADQLDAAKILFDQIEKSTTSNLDQDMKTYASQYRPLRLKCHRLMGQVLAGMQDMDGCEKEFREATNVFKDDAGAWQMLGRILEMTGKTEEAREVMKKAHLLKSLAAGGGGAFGL